MRTAAELLADAAQLAATERTAGWLARKRCAQMAALRNLVITALRLAWTTDIAAVLRHHARDPYRPLATYEIT